MRLDGAIALVTGAGSGIGRAISQELSLRGAHPILLGRDQAKLEQTRLQLADPRSAAILVADVTDRADIAQRLGSLTDRLNLLINNAGIVEAGPLEQQSDAVWRAMFEVNVLAPMALTRDLLPLLRRSGQGRVVNVGSMFGDIAFPYFAAYSAAKFGLRGWSEALRRELADQNIGVTYCAPRGTDTPAAQGFAAYAEAFAMPRDPAAKAARHIVDGMAANARDVYPKGAERFFLLLQRLFPGLIDAALAKQTQRAKTILVRKSSGSPATL